MTTSAPPPERGWKSWRGERRSTKQKRRRLQQQLENLPFLFFPRLSATAVSFLPPSLPPSLPRSTHSLLQQEQYYGLRLRRLSHSLRSFMSVVSPLFPSPPLPLFRSYGGEKEREEGREGVSYYTSCSSSSLLLLSQQRTFFLPLVVCTLQLSGIEGGGVERVC